jgi:integrase
MHEFRLYSGLRPGTLVALRRDWIQWRDRAVSIPKMKSGSSFDLPLSDHMIQVLKRAIAIGDVLFPRSEWVFPKRASRTIPGAASCAATRYRRRSGREKSLPSETDHLLRHTYRTNAQRICLDKIEARLLLDHTVPGIDGVYIHEKALFDRLLIAHEQMTAAIDSQETDHRRVDLIGDGQRLRG